MFHKSTLQVIVFLSSVSSNTTIFIVIHCATRSRPSHHISHTILFDLTFRDYIVAYLGHQYGSHYLYQLKKQAYAIC
jgi:hypothetical protein